MARLLVSKRASKTPSSPIRSLAPLAVKAKSEGKKVFHLNIGQPDIESPKEFLDAVQNFDKKIIGYEASPGNLDLRKAWANYLKTNSGYDVSFENILITTGASEALIFTFMCCADPGDEIIVMEPTYANYLGFSAISGVNLVPVLTRKRDNFRLPSREFIEKSITNRTRAILLCNPNNPTGTVYSKEEIETLLELCEDYNIFFVLDETYREFVYDGQKPVSILENHKNNERVIVIDSLSKRFSLCGARVGCLITANEEVLARSLSIASARLAVPSIAQVAATHMLKTISPNYLTDTIQEYETRRNTLIKFANTTPGVNILPPNGAFYAIADISVENSTEFCKWMLEEFSDNNETLFLAPAQGFYIESKLGLKRVRIASVLDSSKIERSMEILGKALSVYPKKI